MDICNWISNGVNCTQLTYGLVCSKCLPSKQKLYNAYKDAEVKVIDAISCDDVRGDVYEVLKVINRIQKVIELRREFTNHLQVNARDYGHELRISNLFRKVIDYQDHLRTLWNKSIEEVEEVEEIEEKPTPIVCLNQVQKAVNSITEDPFIMFEDDIKSYIEFQSYTKDIWNLMQSALKFTDLQMRYMYNYLLQINFHVVNTYSSIGLLIKGSEFHSVVPVKYRKGDLFPESIIRMYDMLSEDFPTFAQGLTYIKMVISVIPQVNKYKLISKITKINGKGKVVIHHCIDGPSNVGLMVEWVSKNKYRYTVVKV